MCGRFAQSLTASEYRDIVDAQLLQQQQEREQRQRQKEVASQQRSSQRGAKVDDSSSTQKEAREKSSATEHDHLDLQASDDDFYPSFNVAPGTRVPIVRLDEAQPMHSDRDTTGDIAGKAGRCDTLVIQSMRWGLLPHYTTSIPRGPDALRTINARDDAVLSGRSMWTPILRSGKRCVVFCQGFYEWLKKDDGAQRIAHFVGMKDEGQGRVDVQGKKRALMPMAGLYEKCRIDDEDVYSFTIITTESNKQLNFLHDRMPVVLPDRGAIRTWLGLDEAPAEKICGLLRPYAAGELDCYPVPREVGKVGNSDSSYILPVSSRRDGIAAAFGRVNRKQDDSPPKKETVALEQGDITSETHAPPVEEVKSMDVQRENSENLSTQPNMDADEALARRLQRQEERQAEWREKRANKKEPHLKSNGEDENDESSNKRQKTAQATSDAVSSTIVQDKGSSKWSPEPFNPPVSPPRPYGGYSIVDEHGQAHRTPNKTPMQAARGGGNGTGIESPTKSPLNTARRRQEERFKEAAKGSKDIRNFFGGS